MPMQHNDAYRRAYMGAPNPQPPSPVKDDQEEETDEFNELDEEFDPVAYARQLRRRRY